LSQLPSFVREVVQEKIGQFCRGFLLQRTFAHFAVERASQFRYTERRGVYVVRRTCQFPHGCGIRFVQITLADIGRVKVRACQRRSSSRILPMSVPVRFEHLSIIAMRRGAETNKRTFLLRWQPATHYTNRVTGKATSPSAISGHRSQTGLRLAAESRNIMVSVLLFAAVATGGCRSAPHPESKASQIGWRPIGSWSGRGDVQTESFNIESTQWRIKWETKGAASPGAGLFHVVVHSAVSGRPLLEAVEHKGDGRGIAYVTEDPRLYHLVIDSGGVDWSIAVEEAVAGDVEQTR
jgi:hypothetical protein